MGWTGAIVSYAVLWFVFLLMILQRGIITQQEAGEIEPGTPAGAPTNIQMNRKFLWATILAAATLAPIAAIIEFKLITLDDLWFLYPASFNEARR